MNGVAETAFRRHYGEIYRYLRRRTHDPARAEELTQRVFADAVTALAGVEAEGAVLPLLYTVARRRFADELRRERRLHLVQLDEEQGTVEHGPGTARAIAAALEALPEEQRLVVLAKLVQGRPFAEIAVWVGASEDACKMRFSRGLRALRDHLRAEGMEP